MAESSRVHAPPRSYHPLFPQLSLQIVSNPVWEGLQFASISMEMTYMGLIAGNFRPFRAGMAETFGRLYATNFRPVCCRGGGWWVVGSGWCCVCRRVAKARLTTREPISIVGVVQCTARGQCNTHKTSTSTSAPLPPRQRRSHFRNSIYRQRPVHDVFALHLPSTTALPVNEQPPAPWPSSPLSPPPT